MIVNNYINKGYRVHFRSVGQVLQSLFMINNESFNIWSHLLGALVFLSMIAWSAFFFANIRDASESYHFSFREKFAQVEEKYHIA